MASTKEFEAIDIRVGVVKHIEPFPEGKYSTHILYIDFGEEIGTKKSLARLTPHYTTDSLLHKHVLGVVNFPPRQIGKHISEVLTLGVPDAKGNTVLIQPERDVPLGGKLY
ncbi:tRNA-binding protein [Candidatus Peregrinibacteria bacterium CG10_big_fil_rev_8_21_14_0_10_49_16]|nr:MAG: tRNA-binding protein [Candidatus Peregrinibacteria bacterium CG22_combo_CG10-13_8_21_14_all_49_11]PIR52002.1 MAG: tRNA-binding protein [Candidatus Peregrinibacteria bacterium CG10_big_fil_rev_8_21_14_0_10_49_16]